MGFGLVVLLGGACATTGGAPSGHVDPAALVAAEARRDALAPEVQAALRDPSPELRRMGLWVLGRVEEVGTSTLAAPLLMDADPQVAAAAAFALGQIGAPEGEGALLAALRFTKAPQAALRALSKVGTASAALHLQAFCAHPDPEVRAEAALGLGLLKKRLPALEPTFEGTLAPLLQDASPRVRFGAAYALARSAGPLAASALVTALTDPDPEVRMWAAHGLGKAGASPQVLDQVTQDPDWRVRTAVATALGAMGAAGAAEGPHAATRLSMLASVAFARVARGEPLAAGRSLHVLYAALEAAARFPAGRKVLDEVERSTWDGADVEPAASGDVAHVQCAVAVVLDRLEKVVRRVETCGKGVYPEWRRRAAWLELTAAAGGARAAAALLPYARDPDPRVRAAAVVALGEVKDAASTQGLVDLLGSNDPYVLGAAAEILARPDRAGLRPPALAERLGDVLAVLAAQPDASLVVGALDALGQLGPEGLPLVGTLDKLRADPRAAVRRRAAQAIAALTGRKVPFGPTRGEPPAPPPPRAAPVRFQLETARGVIVVRLDGALAPRFTGVLSALAAAGAYDAGTFHRVVSTFVAQGGCPRGDGWGGPGYVVLGETSPAPFARGAVGVATNGRDTAGAQFFFMHAYHPHLDGGYPWVGRVEDGIDVVDALQVDDAIRAVRVLAD